MTTRVLLLNANQSQGLLVRRRIVVGLVCLKRKDTCVGIGSDILLNEVLTISQGHVGKGPVRSFRSLAIRPCAITETMASAAGLLFGEMKSVTFTF